MTYVLTIYYYRNYKFQIKKAVTLLNKELQLNIF